MVMATSPKRRLLLSVIGALVATFTLYQIAFWTLPQFEKERLRKRLWRIAGAHILYEDDACDVYLARPVEPHDATRFAEIFSRLPKVRLLYIQLGCNIPQEGYAALKRARSIQTLRIDDQSLQPEDMASIAAIPGLEMLQFQDTGFSEGSLARLRAAEQLHTLEIMCVSGKPCGKINDEDIQAIAQLPSLKKLGLFGIDLDRRFADAVRARRGDVDIRGSPP
jgi:hypothetical protein